MLAVLSPAKKIDFDVEVPEMVTRPQFVKESSALIEGLKELTPAEIGKLMKISPELSDLNYERYHTWKPSFTKKKARPAAFIFDGEAYRGLRAKEMSGQSLAYAQDHLLILSGLYGALRPLDLIHAYRLEMGTKFGVGDAKNLYAFWDDKITKLVNKELRKQEEKVLVNVASNEYFKSIKAKEIKGEVLNCHFKEEKDGGYKAIMVFAKKARGMMARYMIENQIESKEDLKGFDLEGYSFNAALSTENDWTFTRKQTNAK